MNASLFCLLAVLSADPAVDDGSFFQLSKPFETTIRAQGGTYEELGQPPGLAPGGGYVDPFGAGPCPTCPPDQTGYGFYAGFEFVFVKPHFSSDAAVLFEDDRDNGGAVDRVNTIPFEWDLEFSPRVWVGYVGPSGIGAQVRYWQFDQSEELRFIDSGLNAGSNYSVDFEAVLPLGFDLSFSTLNGESILTRHNLKVDSLDMEGTWHRNYTWGSVTATGGVRYAKLEQYYSAQLFDAADALVMAAEAKNNFEGVGPTVSLFGRRRLGASNFALFVNGRFSALYGNQSGRIKILDPASADPDANPVWAAHNDTLVPVTELQFGVDWSASIWGTTKLFLRAAMEGQAWFDGGTGVYSVDGNSNIPPQDGNLGFFGFIVGGGLTY